MQFHHIYIVFMNINQYTKEIEKVHFDLKYEQ